MSISWTTDSQKKSWTTKQEQTNKNHLKRKKKMLNCFIYIYIICVKRVGLVY